MKSRVFQLISIARQKRLFVRHRLWEGVFENSTMVEDGNERKFVYTAPEGKNSLYKRN